MLGTAIITHPPFVSYPVTLRPADANFESSNEAERLNLRNNADPPREGAAGVFQQRAFVKLNQPRNGWPLKAHMPKPFSEFAV